MERSDEPRLAVLIDADNTAPKWAETIFEVVATLAEASVRRIYGDFSGPHVRSWVKKAGGRGQARWRASRPSVSSRTTSRRAQEKCGLESMRPVNAGAPPTLPSTYR